MKDAFYFSHDSNARHDPKIIALISDEKIGMAGYAYFFILIEILRDQKEYHFPLKLITVLTKEWQTLNDVITQEIIDKMIELGLITKNQQNTIYSESLIERMKYFDDIRRKRSDAGKIGARALWQSHSGAITLAKAKDDKEENRIEENIKNRREKKEEKRIKTLEEIFPHLKDKVFKDAFDAFLAMRVEKKRPATTRAEELLLMKLSKFELGVAVAMLEQSTVNSWTDVYELKEKNNGRANQPGEPNKYAGITREIKT